MPWFRRKHHLPGEDAVVRGAWAGIANAYADVQARMPELASAIDRISVANTVDELESVLSDVCAEYEPLHAALVEPDAPDRIGNLMFYEGAWHEPALRKGEELVQASGTILDRFELMGRSTAIRKRLYPSYTGHLGENPEPPRMWCEALILAIRSYLQT